MCTFLGNLSRVTGLKHFLPFLIYLILLKNFLTLQTCRISPPTKPITPKRCSQLVCFSGLQNRPRQTSREGNSSRFGWQSVEGRSFDFASFRLIQYLPSLKRQDIIHRHTKNKNEAWSDASRGDCFSDDFLLLFSRTFLRGKYLRKKARQMSMDGVKNTDDLE